MKKTVNQWVKVLVVLFVVPMLCLSGCKIVLVNQGASDTESNGQSSALTNQGASDAEINGQGGALTNQGASDAEINRQGGALTNQGASDAEINGQGGALTNQGVSDTEINGQGGALTNQGSSDTENYMKSDVQQNNGAERADQAQPAAEPAKQEQNAARGTPLNVKSAPAVELDLQPYNGGFFSIDLPKGWVLEPVGEYENFGFHAYDPKNPARKIFYYGNMRYFLKSAAAKEAWASYLAFGGYADAQVYADALVLSPATAEQFFYTFNDYTEYAKKYGIVHNFPIFNKLEIVESTPRNSPVSANCVDDSVVRALFEQNGVPCEGLFGAGVANAMTYYMYDNVDTGYYVVYYITGITAPADEFFLLQEKLSESLASFQFSLSYIQQGVQQINQGTELALETGRMLSEAAESCNQAWRERQRVYDALSQKRSDSTLGYDRLYDTVTGEIYRAELGFYDEYDVHRDEYAIPNLERVPDDGYNLYERPIDYYIYK
jgi:hypothetical protein